MAGMNSTVLTCLLSLALATPFAGATMPMTLDSPAIGRSNVRQVVGLAGLGLIDKEWGGTPRQSIFQISDKETRLEIWHPLCFRKKAALLGSFCVAPTTKEMDADPNSLLPRLTFEVRREPDAPPLAVFLFDDEKSSWPAFWGMMVANRTCDELKSHAKATLFEDIDSKERTIHSFINVRGASPHHWHLVALDCEYRDKCPEVESANITFFHPNSDGGNDACSDSSVLGHSVKELQDSLLGAMHAVSLRNVLNVAGLSAFGVFVLYSVFLVMLLFSLLFLIWALRAESNRRFLYLNSLFITCLSAMAYLALATGNGILVLRKVQYHTDSSGSQAAWRVSNPLLALQGSEEQPNPLYTDAYGHAPTYPILWARHVNNFLTTPLLLLSLFLVSGVSINTRAFMLFANVMCCLCWLSGSFITSASRWAFWMFGSMFGAGVLVPLIGVLPTSAARKGRGSRRLYGRLMCITIVVGCLAPWAWILVEGTHALPADLAVLLYGVMDIVSQCVFGMILLRKAPPVMAEWGQEQEPAETRLQPGGGNAAHQQVLDLEDDL